MATRHTRRRRVWQKSATIVTGHTAAAKSTRACALMANRWISEAQTKLQVQGRELVACDFETVPLSPRGLSSFREPFVVISSMRNRVSMVVETLAESNPAITPWPLEPSTPSFMSRPLPIIQASVLTVWTTSLLPCYQSGRALTEDCRAQEPVQFPLPRGCLYHPRTWLLP